MSWVLKGLSCFGCPRSGKTPLKVDSGEWKVAVGEADTPKLWEKSGSGALKMSCACVIVSRLVFYVRPGGYGKELREVDSYI